MENNFIAIEVICTQYKIEFSFLQALAQNGLVQIEIIEESNCIHENQLAALEKMIRLHHELNINIEGIDVIFNLLQKEEILHQELTVLKNRLRLYEGE